MFCFHVLHPASISKGVYEHLKLSSYHIRKLHHLHNQFLILLMYCFHSLRSEICSQLEFHYSHCELGRL